MKRYDHLREKAREWRKDGVSINEICNRMSLSKGTVHYWIKDIPLKIKGMTDARRMAIKKVAKTNSIRYKKLRDIAYDEGIKEYGELIKERDFRDFIMLYLTEGYRRTKNVVSVSNSNYKLIKLGYKWISRLKNKERNMRFSLQCHEDNDEDLIKEFWEEKLGIKKDLIKTIRKSNSGKMGVRKWRSEYGVLSIGSVIHI